ncbi:MAG: hypothetical protein IPH43_04220 [Xanthomonadales bacterium]|nr:hypothetical protein [Xanthomonadales bacterium]
MALAALQLELLQRAWQRLGKQCIEPVEQVERAQDADEIGSWMDPPASTRSSVRLETPASLAR